MSGLHSVKLGVLLTTRPSVNLKIKLFAHTFIYKIISYSLNRMVNFYVKKYV